MTLTVHNLHDFLNKAQSTSHCILYIHWKKCVYILGLEDTLSDPTELQSERGKMQNAELYYQHNIIAYCFSHVTMSWEHYYYVCSGGNCIV